jgi:hypothetical protein
LNRRERRKMEMGFVKPALPWGDWLKVLQKEREETEELRLWSFVVLAPSSSSSFSSSERAIEEY